MGGPCTRAFAAIVPGARVRNDSAACPCPSAYRTNVRHADCAGQTSVGSPTNMDAVTQDRIGALAAAAVRHHLEALTRGDRDGARASLFVGPGQDALIDQYVDAMLRLAPFEIRGCEPRKLQPFPRRMHGIAATVWVGVAVDCAAGPRAAELIVWW